MTVSHYNHLEVARSVSKGKKVWVEKKLRLSSPSPMRLHLANCNIATLRLVTWSLKAEWKVTASPKRGANGFAEIKVCLFAVP